MASQAAPDIYSDAFVAGAGPMYSQVLRRGPVLKKDRDRRKHAMQHFKESSRLYNCLSDGSEMSRRRKCFHEGWGLSLQAWIFLGSKQNYLKHKCLRPPLVPLLVWPTCLHAVWRPQRLDGWTVFTQEALESFPKHPRVRSEVYGISSPKPESISRYVCPSRPPSSWTRLRGQEAQSDMWATGIAGFSSFLGSLAVLSSVPLCLSAFALSGMWACSGLARMLHGWPVKLTVGLYSWRAGT